MNPTVTHEISREDLEKARRDFRRMLRRKQLSPRWIEEHAEELLAQARVEYAARLAEGKAADSVVGWLINGAWWRAQDLLEAQGRRQPTTSIENAFDLADESEPDPEQQALDGDRANILRRALVELPEKERRLLALVYFEGDSIRAAGRKIGWRKTAADEHHGKALERLRAQLGDDRSLLSPATLGPAAWVALESEGSGALAGAARLLSPTHRALTDLAEVGSGAMHRLADQWRRISPLADPAGAAASGGGGRALGACGVAAATLLCGVAASGVLPPVDTRSPRGEPQAEGVTEQARAPRSSLRGTGAPLSTVRPSGEASAAPFEAAAQNVRAASRARAEGGERRASEGTKSRPSPVAQEFGAEAAAPSRVIERSSQQSVSPGILSRPSGAESPSTDSAPASPQPSTPSPSSSGGGNDSSERSASSAEFGL